MDATWTGSVAGRGGIAVVVAAAATAVWELALRDTATPVSVDQALARFRADVRLGHTPIPRRRLRLCHERLRGDQRSWRPAAPLSGALDGHGRAWRLRHDPALGRAHVAFEPLRDLPARDIARRLDGDPSIRRAGRPPDVASAGRRAGSRRTRTRRDEPLRLSGAIASSAVPVPSSARSRSTWAARRVAASTSASRCRERRCPRADRRGALARATVRPAAPHRLRRDDEERLADRGCHVLGAVQAALDLTRAETVSEGRRARLRLAPDGRPRPAAPFGRGPAAARVLSGVIRMASLAGGALPAGPAHALARAGGTVEWAVRPAKRRILAENLGHAVGLPADDVRVRALVRREVVNEARRSVDLLWAMRRPHELLDRHEGHRLRAHPRGSGRKHGVILSSLHLGGWEVATAIPAAVVPGAHNRDCRRRLAGLGNRSVPGGGGPGAPQRDGARLERGGSVAAW